MTLHRNVLRICHAKPVYASMAAVPAMIGLVACAVTQIAAAPYRPPEDTLYTLRRTYVKGDVDRYKVKTTLKSDGNTFNNAKRIIIALTLKEETKELKPDGSAILFDTFEDGSADFDGKTMEVTALLPTLTQTRDRQSHILETKSEGGLPATSEVTAQFARQLIAFYPSKPAKVGDSQDFSYEDAKPAAPTTTKGKWTLAGVETVNGVQTAKIKVVTDTTAEIQDAQTQQKTTINSHFDGSGTMDVKTGKIVAMSGKVTYKGGPFIDGEIDWKLKSADDKDVDKPTADGKSGDKKSSG